MEAVGIHIVWKLGPFYGHLENVFCSHLQYVGILFLFYYFMVIW
jgi:hypothetical protein